MPSPPTLDLPRRTQRRLPPSLRIGFASTALSVVVAVAALLGAPRAARACSCAETNLAARRDAAAAVFEGRVHAITREGNAEVGPARLRVTLEVVQTWKGADSEEIVVTTMSDSAACGVPFEEGRSYLVFATSDEAGALVAGLCGGTTLREQADGDVAALGAGVTPVEVRDAPVQARPAAPSAGGCASCHVGATHARDGAATNGVTTLALGVVAALAAARQKSRTCRRAGAPQRPLSP
jgi:hypothetical protein